MTAVLFIFYVILFWVALGVFAIWVSARMLRVPTEAELELAAAEAEKSQASHTTSAH